MKKKALRLLLPDRAGTQAGYDERKRLRSERCAQGAAGLRR